VSRQSLSRDARIVLFISTGLAFANAVSSVFVSMYLYSYLDGIAALTVFNLGQFALVPLGFILAAPIARRFGERSAVILGLLLLLGFYGLLLALRQESARNLPLLGSLNGLGQGIFWFSFNIATARAAEESDKGRFYGLMGALGSASMAAGPFASTLALSLAPSRESGYGLIFLSIVAVSGAMAATALALPREGSKAPIRILKHLRSGGDGRWRFALRANFAMGIRDGASWSIMSILILQGAGSETLAGYLATAFAVLGIAANFLVGKLLTPRRYSALWGWGSIAAVASALVISLWPSPAGAAVSGALWTAGSSLVYLPFSAAFFGLLAAFIREEGSVAGRNIAAEFPLNLGRAIGAGSFLALSLVTDDYARILYPIVTLSLPASWLIFRRAGPLERPRGDAEKA
jgi:YQGE family putative transporter